MLGLRDIVVIGCLCSNLRFVLFERDVFSYPPGRVQFFRVQRTPTEKSLEFADLKMRLQ
jgi:hypothetical protein